MTQGRKRPVIAMGALPVSAYIAVTLVAPAGVLVLYSFWEAGFFTVERTLTWENYARVSEDAAYWRLILKSLVVGLVAALVAVPLAYVVAYSAIFRFKRAGNVLLALVMLSMLASYIVRIYAWKSILGPEGLVNSLLQSVGLVDRPLEFLLYGNFAVVLTLVNILVPFAVLPIFSALQNVDRDTIAASRDLGSSGTRTFRLVTLPLSMPGVSAAFLFCFILASADYVTPQLVGGTNGLLIGRVISDQFGPSGNLPFGAALAVAMLVSLAIGILLLGVLG
ncbi:MAG: ABC transporter permease, partial [Ilumatobacteraceae bacterium]|nr:ABC transporter permease [Ilumatobacteraceae bacterium]